MLKHIIAVITASVSFAGCTNGPNGTPANQPHTVNRPITTNQPTVDREPSGAPGAQTGSATTTQPSDSNGREAGTTDTATGGPGNTSPGTSARSSAVDEPPARGTTGR